VTSVGDPTTVAVRVARALENAGVEYAVGGSVASSAYGEPRATLDLDVAIRLTGAAQCFQRPRLLSKRRHLVSPTRQGWDFVVRNEIDKALPSGRVFHCSGSL
jgi:hypothetical protein